MIIAILTAAVLTYGFAACKKNDDAAGTGSVTLKFQK
jgi:hypothetical protein